MNFNPFMLLSAVFVYFSSLCVSGRRESLNKNVLHKKMFSRSLPLASSSENLIGYRSSLGAYNQLCCFSFLLLAQCIYFFIHKYIDYAMIKHFGEGINYPINSPVLGFSENSHPKGCQEVQWTQIKLIILLIKHFPSLLFWEKQVCISGLMYLKLHFKIVLFQSRPIDKIFFYWEMATEAAMFNIPQRLLWSGIKKRRGMLHTITFWQNLVPYIGLLDFVS